MVYICADDYGWNESASLRIEQCAKLGALHKVSVFPNLGNVDLQKVAEHKDVRLSLHLNLVEGKCMADANLVDLIADEAGNLKHTFVGLLKLNLFQGKKLEEQVYREIKAQILFWKGILPEDRGFCVDSHQHTHMIPAVWKALLRVLREEKIQPEYLRIPVEPILPYLKTPALYFTYSPINLAKQWLLKFLWMLNRDRIEEKNLSGAHFMGILFSGKMDEKRVRKILPRYMKLAEKDGRDIEVLFHPGYLEKGEIDLKKQRIVFEKFYLSKDRKTEFDSVMKLSERSVW